ncbi:MAG: hypothetical protein SAL70_20830 [Scytonema sp. PMC 1070.18]|nr:hypothetical protein [Scytonema sp. PMC 1070.18]
MRAPSIFCHHHHYRLCKLHTISRAIAHPSAKTNHELRSPERKLHPERLIEKLVRNLPTQRCPKF